MPGRNPFDVLANRLVTRPRGMAPLGVARPPRRFAQGMAATVTFATGVALLAGHAWIAWALEGLMLTAVVAAVFGDFCEGAYLYQRMRRRTPVRRPIGRPA